MCETSQSPAPTSCLLQDIVAKEDERLCEHAMLIRAQIAREEGQLRDSLVWLNRAHSSSPKSSRFASISQ